MMKQPLGRFRVNFRPSLLGALLDIVAVALRNESKT